MLLLSLLAIPGAGATRHLTSSSESNSSGDTVPLPVATLRDFEDEDVGPTTPPFISAWNWPAWEKAAASNHSSMSVGRWGSSGGKCGRLVVTSGLYWGTADSYATFDLFATLLPPEADAVRMRVKVLRGSAVVAVGAPTIYPADSDVWSQLRTLNASTSDDWEVVELSLFHGVARNYRRDLWTSVSPTIYFPRWIQDVLQLYVLHPTDAEILIDDVQLISTGAGRPYPTFSPADIAVVGQALEFNAPAGLEPTFTASHLVRAANPPAKLSLTNGPTPGTSAWQTVLRGQEEVSFAGVKVQTDSSANALVLKIAARHPRNFTELALDFFVYAVPESARPSFPWHELVPTPATGFDYDLSPASLARANSSQPFDLAFFHARRVVANSAVWETLVIPFADFVCVYGSGSLAAVEQQQSTLRGEEIIAMLFLPPWRQRSDATTVLIDSVSFGTLKSAAAGALRSFAQVANASAVKLVKLPQYPAYGGMRYQTGDENGLSHVSSGG